MKTVTINNNWVKISDFIEKDSVILVSDGSEINITDNTDTDTVKFSKYKKLENFKTWKKSKLWIRSGGLNSTLDIFELKTEAITNPELGGGFPSGETSYENIGEIEKDIIKINDKINIFKIDIEE